MKNDIANNPVFASTVLLIRDTNQGLEVFMVTRNKKIDFAYGALVFPGGKLDINDSDRDLIRRCNDRNLENDYIAMKICAIRETFEETGVFLARAGNDDKIINGQRTNKLIRAYRESLHAGDISLLEILDKEDLTLALDQLTHFARWVTPSFFSRRFDASFFIAKLPNDQLALHDEIESDNSLWIKPDEAIKEADRGQATIDFANFETYDELLLHTKKEKIVTVEPLVNESNGKVTYSITSEAGYGITEFTEYGGPSLKIKSSEKN